MLLLSTTKQGRDMSFSKHATALLDAATRDNAFLLDGPCALLSHPSPRRFNTTSGQGYIDASDEVETEEHLLEPCISARSVGGGGTYLEGNASLRLLRWWLFQTDMFLCAIPNTRLACHKGRRWESTSYQFFECDIFGLPCRRRL